MNEYNLLRDPFLPVLLRSGKQRTIAIHEIVQEDGDYPVGICWGRSDLNMACFELTIGLITVVLGLQDEDAWNGVWRTPPTQSELRDRCSVFYRAFNLIGDGPRFMQDFDRLSGRDGEIRPIEMLAIDAAVVNTREKNGDLLTHRGRYAAVGLPAAGMMLYALQAYAPEGGGGHRTSIRGGGPLTVFVIPVASDDNKPMSLWRKILANIVVFDSICDVSEDKWSTVFPWMGPANMDHEIHAADVDVHSLQHYFGMPRRILLNDSDDVGECTLTGEQGRLVAQYQTLNKGIDYGTWRHPMTPYRYDEKSKKIFPLLAKSFCSDFSGYQARAAVAVGHKDTVGMWASENVQVAKARRSRVLSDNDQTICPRLVWSGWAMEGARADQFVWHEQPLFVTNNPEKQEDLDEFIRTSVKVADVVSGKLANVVAKLVKGVKKSQVKEDFYLDTEKDLDRIIKELICEINKKDEYDFDEQLSLLRKWGEVIRKEALNRFDEHVLRVLRVPAGNDYARSVVDERRKLKSYLYGNPKNKRSKSIFESLGIPMYEENTDES